MLNSLIKVNDQSSQCILDFFLRLMWDDPRWYMPDLWDALNPYATLEGMDITGYIKNQNELNVWLPDLIFMNVNEKEILSEFVRFYPNGTFFWSRHMMATFSEPNMNYAKFPQDSQNFSLTLQSYSYIKEFVTVQW